MRTPAILIVVTSALFRHGLAAEVARLTMLPCGRYEGARDFMITNILHGVYANDIVKGMYPELCDLQISSAVWNDPNCGVNTLPGDGDRRLTKSEDEAEGKKRIESSFHQNHPTEMADKKCMEDRKILEMLIPLANSVSSGRTAIITMSKQHQEDVCPIMNRIVGLMQNHHKNNRMTKVGVFRWIEDANKLRKEFCGNEDHDNIEHEVRASSPPSSSLSPCDQFKEAIDDILTQSLTGQNSPRDAVFSNAKKYPSLCDLQILSTVWDDPYCGVSELDKKEDTVTERKGVFQGSRNTRTSKGLQLIQPGPDDGPKCIGYQVILTKMIPLALEGKPNKEIVGSVANRYHKHICPIVNRIADKMKNVDHDVADDETMTDAKVKERITAVDEIRKEFCGKKAHGNIGPEVRASSPPSPSLSPCNQFKEAFDDILTKSLTGQNSPRDAVFTNVDKHGSLCDLQILSAVWGEKCGVSTLPKKEDTTTRKRGILQSFRTKSKDPELIPPGPDDGPECIDYQRILTKMIPLALEGKPNQDIVGSVAYRYHEHVCPTVMKAVEMQKSENQRNGVKKLTNSAGVIQRLFCKKVSPTIVGIKKKWKNGKPVGK